MKLRQYQQDSIDALYQWWASHTDTVDAPLVVLPTGAGKSVVIAELVRLLFDTWPEDHPRTVVLVPSRELAEQNAEKLRALLPPTLTVGYYSASLGRKQADADVIVATIGSIYKDAAMLGNIKCVVIDEAHLVQQTSAEAGRYRKFLSSLGRYCRFRVVGYTATPFRGDGTWLTDGEQPLFTGVAHTTTMRDLLEHHPPYLSQLVRPMDIRTRIDTSHVNTTAGDYNIGELSDAVDDHLEAAAAEAIELAADRSKWIAFCATVANAQHFRDILTRQGIHSQVVTGDTEKADRQLFIHQFRQGDIRCIITVMALATGFDVPDVDCLIWLRPTKSPVLYVQGFGRGTRIAPNKADCLVLDFTDTVERLGPVDTIKGRRKRAKSDKTDTPFRICDNCGERAPAKATECPTCGQPFEVKNERETRSASNAAILSIQQQLRGIVHYDVQQVTYGVHSKPGKPSSLRVDYWSGLRIVCSEWICFDHGGFSGAKAQAWWQRRCPDVQVSTTKEAYLWIQQGYPPQHPEIIIVDESEKYPRLISYQWKKLEQVA